MIFNTPIFSVFFLTFFVIYSFWILRRTPRVLFVLVSSLVFYASWNYRFIPLLILSAVVDYTLAIFIHKAQTPRHRKLLLAASIGTNLAILATFKYADFAIQSAIKLVGLFGFETTSPLLGLILPVGISFYTFQSMSYTIDVYRKQMVPRRGLLEFTAALAFFPQLVAGPILRAREILPQFHSLPTPTWPGVKHGFVLITIGLFKKTIADLLGEVVNSTFDGSVIGLLEAWTGVLAFAGQIYGDFSGYTDMAIGLGLVLGFKIPMNFRLPYFAISPVDFWRRWHISLSSWLRDYLYISLGGNRRRRYRNVMITMLLGGLWHGAAWTFIAWGAFHGVLVVATQYFSSVAGLQKFARSPNGIVRLMKWSMTFYLILLGWVLFRAPDLTIATDLFATMHGFGPVVAATDAGVTVCALVVLALVLMHLIDWVVIVFSRVIEARRYVLWPLLVLFQLLSFLIGAPSDAFIYFQF